MIWNTCHFRSLKKERKVRAEIQSEVEWKEVVFFHQKIKTVSNKNKKKKKSKIKKSKSLTSTLTPFECLNGL